MEQKCSSAFATVLTAFGDFKTVKTYTLVEGAVHCEPYGHASHYRHQVVPIGDIEQFSKLIEALSGQRNQVLVRGKPAEKLASPVRRKSENFPEPVEGIRWAMLDFDDLALPEGMDPLSPLAVAHAIGKLPVEFQRVTYFYQFSASSGVCKPDGSPLKKGLNAHVFFFFDRPIPGVELAAFLELHCVETGFYKKSFDKSGAPRLIFGFDPAVLRSPVQPHYVGFPVFGAGVACKLNATARQGLVKGERDHVTMPELGETTVARAVQRRHALLADYKRSLGYEVRRSTSVAPDGGVGVSTFFARRDGVAPALNRICREVRVSSDGQFARLYFEGEGSPGSWYVSRRSPTLAHRYGDGETLHLKELSLGAFVHVRDELKWFRDVERAEGLPLTEAGFLPDLTSFITSRFALIEAPTGSGKTTAFARYAEAKRSEVIFYAAQTTALVGQMFDDLASKSVTVTHYRDVPGKDALLKPGVYVTTNESLTKFVRRAVELKIDYILVVDEAHTTLDDFMSTADKNKLLHDALARCKQGLLMTATLTNLQLAKWIDVVSKSCGALRPELFKSYRFSAVKSNPLRLKPVATLGGDLVALLRDYAHLKRQGKTLPRTVVIAPTSRMRWFQLLVDQHGLGNEATIVSRKESTPEDVEAARTSDKPLLIASPMFSLGLNFEHAPTRLWAYFSNLDVDTSQVIQTLNRANRSAAACEVRLYVGECDGTPLVIPPARLAESGIKEKFEKEATVSGALDHHFHIERNVYIMLRDLERTTSKALGHLIENDGFQNFHIETDWSENLTATKADQQLAKELKAAAAESYAQDIESVAALYSDESSDMLIHLLSEAMRKKSELYKSNSNVLVRDLECKIVGLSMALCQLSKATDGKKIKPMRLLRLFAEVRPMLTAQFDTAFTKASVAAAVEKTHHLASLVRALGTLKLGEMSLHEFAVAMKGKLSGSILALSESEKVYLAIESERLRKLTALSEEAKHKASKGQRQHIRERQMSIASDFLCTIGVSADVTKSTVVVPDWDFSEMAESLDRSALRLIHQSIDGRTAEQREESWSGSHIDPGTCSNCINRKGGGLCWLGIPIWHEAFSDGLPQPHCEHSCCPGKRKTLPKNITPN
jgi:hypothetical protein